jgi:hypothetical protein
LKALEFQILLEEFEKLSANGFRLRFTIPTRDLVRWGQAVADLSEGTQPARFWCWQGNYPHSGLVCDGVGWSAEIAHSDRSVVSSGDNCFPGWYGRAVPILADAVKVPLKFEKPIFTL